MHIVTKEQLKSHIHSIHDYIRNSGTGYGYACDENIYVFIWFENY